MKKILQGLVVLALLFSVAFAQNRTVTGTVTDQSGQPVPGVTVKGKGSNVVTSTSANGNFSISIPASVTVIEFSALGYANLSKSIGSTNIVNAEMAESTKELSEVMVVAYGTVKKESFTGSASVITAKNFESRPTTSFQKSLQGAAAGVQVTSVSGQPGASTQIRVRGIGSLSASSSPLYVIDGVAITSTGTDLTSVAQTADFLATLNQNDIESVTILKDAAATSIYGSRAANGVVLITTKQGKAGATRFSANISGGYSSQAVDKHDVLSAEEYYRVYFNSYYATAIAGGATSSAATTTANLNTINKLTSVNNGIRYNNPFNSLNPFNADGSLASGVRLLYDTDWESEVLRRGVTKDATVSASGGTEKLKYYVSGGYFDQKGIVLASDFKRFTGKFNLTNDVNSYLSFGVNTTLANSIQNTPVGGTLGSNPVRFAEATANIYSLYVRDPNTGEIQTDATGKPLYNYINPVTPDYNPVGLSELNDYISKTTRINAIPYIQVKFLDGFTLKSSVSLDYITLRENQFFNLEHGDGVTVKGRGYRYSKEDITTTYINTLNYDKSFGKHTVNVLLGQEAFKNKYDSFNAIAVGFAFAGQKELIAASTPFAASSNYTEERFSSYFSRLTYDFDNKYYLSGSFRRDGSSVFGTNNKYGNFWSVGGAWRISKERFMDDVTFLNELKLRASYGLTGNNTIGRYAAQGLYSISGAYEGVSGSAYSQLANGNLQWEKIKTTEVGIEFAALKSRITGEVSYYKRGSDGLLFAQPISRLTGFSSVNTNLASVENRGLEVMIGGTPLLNRDWKWDVSFNISTNNNKIKKLTQAEVVSGSNLLKVGGDRYAWYLREYAGVDPVDGRAMWYMDDASGNKVTTKTYANAKLYDGLGSALPDFFGGLNNTVRFKDFDFSIFSYFSYGGKVYDALYQTLSHNGISPGQQMSRDVLNAWTPSNTGSAIPRFLTTNADQSNSSSSRFLFDGSYIRVKNITLGYTLNKDWARKAMLGSARIFIMAENALTFAKHKGADPEFDITGNSTSDIPNVKTFSVGLNVGF